jgi:hypothetical protein
VRAWIKRLEREAGDFHGTLRLPDGTEIRYEGGEMLDALLAAIDGQEHRLLPYLRQAEPETTEGMPGLIRAIEGSRARAS